MSSNRVEGVGSRKFNLNFDGIHTYVHSIKMQLQSLKFGMLMHYIPNFLSNFNFGRFLFSRVLKKKVLCAWKKS